MSWQDTHFGFVNTWECDENQHMNVQFYYKRFALAAEVFAAMHGLDRTGGARPPIRHVRYHRELRFNVSTLVRSAVIADGAHQGMIAHQLLNVNTGELSATALDHHPDITPELFATLPMVTSKEAERVLPRGVSFGPIMHEDSAALLADGHATVTNFHVVQSEDLSSDGCLSTQHYIGRFTDGAPHIWDHTGLTTQWLEKNDYGRVAVEMKLCPEQPVGLGTPLRQISWVAAMTNKTFSIRHQLEHLDTGEIVAGGDVIGLVMDLKTRRAVAIPDVALKRFNP